MAEILNINKVVEDVVINLGVQIRNTSVDLSHKFILVPLVYNRDTCDRDFIELEVDRAEGQNPSGRPVFPQVHGVQQQSPG